MGSAVLRGRLTLRQRDGKRRTAGEMSTIPIPAPETARLTDFPLENGWAWAVPPVWILL